MQFDMKKLDNGRVKDKYNLLYIKKVNIYFLIYEIMASELM